MNVQPIVDPRFEALNEASFLEKAAALMEEDVVILDFPSGREMKGADRFFQYYNELLDIIPDLTSKIIDQETYRNKVVSRLQLKGQFTGTFHTTQGTYSGNGNPIEIEYQIEQEFNAAGKVSRLVLNYNLSDFMYQLCRRYRPL